MVHAVNDSDIKEILASHPRVIVKFYADWCGSCRLFAPKFKRLSDDDRFGSIRFIEINAEENEISRKLGGVDNLPYFTTFLQGERLEGSSTSKEEVVTEMLDKLAAS